MECIGRGLGSWNANSSSGRPAVGEHLAQISLFAVFDWGSRAWVSQRWSIRLFGEGPSLSAQPRMCHSPPLLRDLSQLLPGKPVGLHRVSTAPLEIQKFIFIWKNGRERKLLVCIPFTVCVLCPQSIPCWDFFMSLCFEKQNSLVQASYQATLWRLQAEGVSLISLPSEIQSSLSRPLQSGRMWLRYQGLKEQACGYVHRVVLFRTLLCLTTENRAIRNWILWTRKWLKVASNLKALMH